MNRLFDIDNNIKDYVKKNVDNTNVDSIEKTILYLKENDISQVQTIYLLNTLCDIPFSTANLYVMKSKAWNQI